jgi:hypothetical protein
VSLQRRKSILEGKRNYSRFGENRWHSKNRHLTQTFLEYCQKFTSLVENIGNQNLISIEKKIKENLIIKP